MTFTKENRKGNRNGEKSDKLNLANTRELTRIICYFKEMKTQANIKLICYDLGLGASRCKDSINWLVNNRILIKEKHNNSTKVYSINDEWMKLKEK